jgi:hypothetical protein
MILNICGRKGSELWNRIMLILSVCHVKFIISWRTIYLSMRIFNPNPTLLFSKETGKNWWWYSTITQNTRKSPCLEITWRTRDNLPEPMTLPTKNPYPWTRVRVFTGTGTGSPGNTPGLPVPIPNTLTLAGIPILFSSDPLLGEYYVNTYLQYIDFGSPASPDPDPDPIGLQLP